MTPSERIRDDASRAQWAAGEGRRLIAFARGSRHRDGFGWLDEDGRTDPDRPVATYITAWMTYVFCLAHMLGDDDVVELIDHGLTSISTVLYDEQFGGWFHSTRREDRQEAYDHAFVVLAAATGDGWSPGRPRPAGRRARVRRPPVLGVADDPLLHDRRPVRPCLDRLRGPVAERGRLRRHLRRHPVHPRRGWLGRELAR